MAFSSVAAIGRDGSGLANQSAIAGKHLYEHTGSWRRGGHYHSGEMVSRIRMLATRRTGALYPSIATSGIRVFHHAAGVHGPAHMGTGGQGIITELERSAG